MTKDPSIIGSTHQANKDFWQLTYDLLQKHPELGRNPPELYSVEGKRLKKALSLNKVL